MDHIVLDGVPPYDGRYVFDIFSAGHGLQGYELSWLKRFSGYLVVDIDEEAFGDHEVITVLALIALCRAGKVSEQEVPTLFDRFQHTEFAGMIRLEMGERVREAESDAGPPPSRSSVNGGSSGAGSSPSSETSQPTLVTGGTPDSATSESAPETSAG
jgi:hypothetical protein